MSFSEHCAKVAPAANPHALSPHYGDNFIPIIPTEYQEHTLDLPFCWDQTCPCHEDQQGIDQVHEWYQNGLISAEDATRIVEGKTL